MKEKLTEGKWRSRRRCSGRNVKEVVGGERARRALTANTFPESCPRIEDEIKPQTTARR